MLLSFTIPASCLPACCGCPTEGDLEVIVTGYTGCGCFEDIHGTHFEFTAHDAITGAFSVPMTAPGTWQVLIGTVDLQVYTDEDCEDPDGPPVETEVYLGITCNNDNAPDILSVFIFLDPAPDGTGPLFQAVGAFGDVLPNIATCDGLTGALVTSVEVNQP